MKLRKTEKTRAIAASKAGMDEKTARKWAAESRLPSQVPRERAWRTRPDPFAEVWPELERILHRSPTVEAKTLFDYLTRCHEGVFEEGQLRTLQRRVKRWRASDGPAQEVMFAQKHVPGRQSQSDFTRMGKIGVTIARQPFDHLIHHFVLTYSNWEAATICFSESFESLTTGVQNGLWKLGAAPREHRTDSLSAAVNNLSQREEFTQRYQGLLRHYGMSASRTQAGKAHENGDVEQSHHRFKRAVEQELLLRDGRDFESVAEYEEFLQAIVGRRNAGRRRRLEEELRVMRELPKRRLEDFTRMSAKVSSESLIRVRKNIYSVDSRLIKEQVNIRLFHGHLEVRHGQELVESIPRLRGEGKHRINYRHVIHSLVRKPGAFRRYRYREDLFPNVLFRLAWDELRRDCPATADRQYLEILQLAATQGEERTSAILGDLIESGKPIRHPIVEQRLANAEVPRQPWRLNIPEVDVSSYDRLLSNGCGVRE